MTTVDQRQLAPEALRNKVVLYLFWATWCPICVGEMPDFARLHAQYRERGLELVAVALDDDPKAVANFWRQGGYRFPAVMRSDEMRAMFGRIVGTPTLVIVDREGKERYRHLGMASFADLEAIIAELL